MFNNLIMERQFLPSAAKLTNGFPCLKNYEKSPVLLGLGIGCLGFDVLFVVFIVDVHA